MDRSKLLTAECTSLLVSYAVARFERHLVARSLTTAIHHPSVDVAVRGGRARVGRRGSSLAAERLAIDLASRSIRQYR